jgi:hypothetical protein
MKKLFFIAVCAFTIYACADTSEDRTESDVQDRNESNVHPPEEAVPDTMTIKQDSLIAPDSAKDSTR